MDNFNNTVTDKGVQEINLQMLPVSSHTLWIDNAIYLDDNIDRIIDGLSLNISNQNPVKLMMLMMVLCSNGNITASINQKDILLSKGDLLLVMPGAIIERFSISSDCKVMVCAMTQRRQHLEEIPSRSTIEIGQIFLSNVNPAIFHINEEQTQLFIDLYRTEREIIKHITPEYIEESFSNYFRTIACMLASWTKETRSNVTIPVNRETDIFSKFINDVHTHAAKERSVTFYADKACLSPKYFARIITKTSGQKPSHWIKNYVILEAKAMLGTGKYTIQQVSDRLNFPNASFFCKYFRAEVGISPGQYIKKLSA